MTRRDLLAGLALLGAGLLLGGLLAETALRVYATRSGPVAETLRAWDPSAVQIEPHGDIGYRQKPNSTYHYVNGTVATSNAMRFRGPLVTVPKPPGTTRILLLGESSTHGWGVPDTATIDTYMRRILAARYPGRRFDVVNLAFDGYDAYQIYLRLVDDGLALEPDVIVVNAGINDVRNARFANLRDRDPRTVLWGSVLERLEDEERRGGPTLWSRMKHYTYLARIPGIVTKRIERPVAKTRQLAITPHPEAVDNFERNIARIADTAGARGIPLILSTPPSLLAGHYEGRTLNAHDYWIVDIPTTQQWRDQLAERLRGVAARRAASGQRIAYVPHNLLDPALFIDDCHLKPEGNRRIAEDFVTAVAPYLADRRAPAPR